MSKKDKELARLRREVEVLRAQLGTSKTIPQAKRSERSTKAPPRGAVPQTMLKRDLLKTGVLTLISLTLLATLYLTQPHWGKIYQIILRS